MYLLVWLTLLLPLLLQSTNAQSFTCSVGSGDACPVAFCPGDEVTYTCDVGTAMGNTVWEFTEGTCEEENDEIVLLQSAGASCFNSISVCQGFVAENIDPGPNQPCTVSILTVNLSKAANETVIKCLNIPLSGNATEIGSATLSKTEDKICFCSKIVLRAVNITGCTTDSVTLMWEEPVELDSPVFQYILSASPPVENCNPNCTVGPSTSQFVFTGLEAEVRYTLTLRADNCEGAQQGVVSVMENIYIPMLMTTKFLSSSFCGLYTNKDLVKVENTWKEISSISLNGETCAIVLLYEITYESNTGEQVTYTVLPSECSAGECSHSFDVPVDGSVSQYSVSVTAVGMGIEVTSNTRTVETMNNILLVEITTTSQPVMATCSFLSGFTGHALCRVDFTGPDGVTYTSVSTERGSAGESVTVELTLNGAALLPSTTYSYQATLEDPSDESMCVKGIGQFTTEEHNDCNIKDLGTSASDSSECGEGEMAGDIPNGMLCYTGLTPGSTAAYSCDKGYELNGTSVLACLPSGMWNESQPMCASSAPAKLSVAANYICFVLLFLYYFCN